MRASFAFDLQPSSASELPPFLTQIPSAALEVETDAVGCMRIRTFLSEYRGPYEYSQEKWMRVRCGGQDE